MLAISSINSIIETKLTLVYNWKYPYDTTTTTTTITITITITDTTTTTTTTTNNNYNDYKTSISLISSKRIDIIGAPSIGLGQTHSPGRMHQQMIR